MLNIKLRAHHGLCITFFEGKGYSDDFIKNMKTVIYDLSQNPDIMIVAEEDRICAACPNNINGLCKSIEKVDAYDKKVLQLCNIRSGNILSWESFKDLVNKNIIKAGRICDVCGDCQWNYICTKKKTK